MNKTRKPTYRSVSKVFKPTLDTLGTYCFRGFHKKSDLALIQKIDLEKNVKTKDLIRQLKALTTNNIKEAAYFETNGKKYRLQIHIEKNDDSSN